MHARERCARYANVCHTHIGMVWYCTMYTRYNPIKRFYKAHSLNYMHLYIRINWLQTFVSQSHMFLWQHAYTHSHSHTHSITIYLTACGKNGRFLGQGWHDYTFFILLALNAIWRPFYTYIYRYIEYVRVCGKCECDHSPVRIRSSGWIRDCERMGLNLQSERLWCGQNRAETYLGLNTAYYDPAGHLARKKLPDGNSQIEVNAKSWAVAIGQMI